MKEVKTMFCDPGMVHHFQERDALTGIDLQQLTNKVSTVCSPEKRRY
jgi:hypothetical protein